MPGQSRRKFLTRGSLGAVAVGVALTPNLLTGTAWGAAPETAGSNKEWPESAEPVVAYLQDPSSGQVVVMVGDREVVVHDSNLARQLARIARSASSS